MDYYKKYIKQEFNISFYDWLKNTSDYVNNMDDLGNLKQLFNFDENIVNIKEPFIDTVNSNNLEHILMDNGFIFVD